MRDRRAEDVITGGLADFNRQVIALTRASAFSPPAPADYLKV
jgi:hypothetical protein